MDKLRNKQHANYIQVVNAVSPPMSKFETEVAAPFFTEIFNDLVKRSLIATDKSSCKVLLCELTLHKYANLPALFADRFFDLLSGQSREKCICA